MVKKKLLALGVSVAAVTAVAGAGFAAWAFGEEAKANTGLGVTVTAAYQFGEVTVGDTVDTVVLDQSGVTLAKSGALGTAVANVTATWTIDKASYTNYEGNLTYSVNVYVNDALSTYVDCGTGNTGAATTADDVVGAGYTKYVLTPTTSADTTTSTTDATVTITLANPLAFVSDGKPETFAEYQAMVAAVKGVEASSVATGTDYTVAAADKPVVIEFVVTKTA